MKKKGTSSIPTSFLQKVYDMLSNSSLISIISWSPEGTEFIIYSLNEFTETVLKAYFKHSNLASFIRQLNMYDFHKVRTNTQEHIYKHPLFLRGRPDLLKEIHRKTSEQNWQIVPKSALNKKDVDPVINKLIQLNKKNVAYEGQINTLEDKVETLTNENKILADQLWESKEILNKIENALMFFVKMFKQNGGSEESFGNFENLLSITEYPGTEKRQKIEDLGVESPLNISGFGEDLSVDDKIEQFNENRSEVSFDDRIELLFDN